MRYSIRNADETDPFGGTYGDDAVLLLLDWGVNAAEYEKPFRVAVDGETGEIVAALTFGIDDEIEGFEKATFSVAVDPDHRRRGLARRLVEGLLENHRGVEITAWVIDAGMAALLLSIGFEADGRNGWWTPDDPYMRRVA